MTVVKSSQILGVQAELRGKKEILNKNRYCETVDITRMCRKLSLVYSLCLSGNLLIFKKHETWKQREDMESVCLDWNEKHAGIRTSISFLSVFKPPALSFHLILPVSNSLHSKPLVKLIYTIHCQRFCENGWFTVPLQKVLDSFFLSWEHRP